MTLPYLSHTANRYRRPNNIHSLPNDKRPQLGFRMRSHTIFGINNSTTANNDEHWCETCDRGFPTADSLDRHKQQHEKCNIDGCQFVAHPKIITRHIQMQHSSGLYKKISKLDNPEEIQKWREERKKKYPTRNNIEKKIAEYKEKIERGEKMSLRHHRNKMNTSTDQTAARKRTRDLNKKNQNHRNNKPNLYQQQNVPSNKDKPSTKKVPKIFPKIPSVVKKNKLLPFTGILGISMDDEITEEVYNMPNCNNSLIEEDEYNADLVEEPVQKPIQEPVVCGALTSLMCDYGSSDEQSDENDKPIKLTTPKQPLKIDQIHKHVDTIHNINTNNHVEIINNDMRHELESFANSNVVNDVSPTNKNKDNSDSDSGPEEIKTVKINTIEPTSLEIPKTKGPPLNTSKNFFFRNDHKLNSNYKHKVPSTLLQKLLYKEIRQERNIVLQCTRYIKKMNYFEKSQK